MVNLMGLFDMKRISIPTAGPDAQKKSEWVTPDLSRMSIEQTLTGRVSNPSEDMSSNPNGRVPGAESS